MRGPSDGQRLPPPADLNVLLGSGVEDGAPWGGRWARAALATLSPPVAAALLAVSLPLVTWINTGSRGPIDAITETPTKLFLLGALALVGLLLLTADRLVPGSRIADPWLGALVLYTAALGWRTLGAFATQTAIMVLGGLVYLTLARHLHEAGAEWARDLLLAGGVVQVGYVIVQTLGYNPLWSGWRPIGFRLPIGTLGNPAWLGAYLAPLVALAPPPAWPVSWRAAGRSSVIVLLVTGIVLSGSRIALGAALVGVVVRYRPLPWWPVAGTAAGAVTYASVWPLKAGALGSLEERFAVWLLGTLDWLHQAPLLGLGLGGWYARFPDVQMRAKLGFGELFTQAHNEWLQVGYEGGLVGLALVVGWVWAHRRAWTAPTAWSGAVAALAVTTVTLFPFHVPQLAGASLVLLGLALGQPLAFEGDPS